MNGLIGLLLVLTMFGNAEPELVRIVGSLKNMMHEGDLTAKVKISEIGPLKDVYGLGAEAGLKGEILIDGATAWVGRVVGDEIGIESTAETEAALLVYAHVPKWHWVDVPKRVGNHDALQDFIKQVAALYGLDASRPIPFLLQGKTAILKWHVIEWPEGRQDHSPQKHRNSGLHGTATDRDAMIVGFFSQRHMGVFTHHDSYLHMHVRFTDEPLVAHVDNLNPRGMRLALPVIDDSM